MFHSFAVRWGVWCWRCVCLYAVLSHYGLYSACAIRFRVHAFSTSFPGNATPGAFPTSDCLMSFFDTLTHKIESSGSLYV